MLCNFEQADLDLDLATLRRESSSHTLQNCQLHVAELSSLAYRLTPDQACTQSDLTEEPFGIMKMTAVLSYFVLTASS